MILSLQNTNKEEMLADVRVEIESGDKDFYRPACVTVYDGKKLVAKVIARIEPKEGADGGWYDCVVLTKERSVPTPKKAKIVFHHDDPPCRERLDAARYCPACNLYPDTQSVCIYSYCPKCDCKLENMQCPQCKEAFINPSY